LNAMPGAYTSKGLLKFNR